MDFSTIGSINNYAKTLKMQAKWNLKKKSGDVTSHTSPMDEWLKSPAAPVEEDEGGKDKKLSSILQKAYTGKKLTADEREYLQAKDPLSYQKLQANEQEQKAYEQELKKCRTKEDVQRLKLSRIGSSLATVKSIENNPHITQEKKLRMISLENAKCAKLERSTQAFVKRGEYAQLPTEAEQAKAEKALQAAEQAKRTSEAEPAADQPEAGRAETVRIDYDTGAEKDRPAAGSDGGQPTSSAERKPSTSVEPDSPEIRKVRRAKAKAAYAAARASTIITEDGAGVSLEVQA